MTTSKARHMPSEGLIQLASTTGEKHEKEAQQEHEAAETETSSADVAHLPVQHKHSCPQAAQPQACGCCPTPMQKGKGHGKGGTREFSHVCVFCLMLTAGWAPWPAFYNPEPRFDGWTRGEWEEWISSSCGSRWCSPQLQHCATMTQDWDVLLQ